ncbi:MAG: HAMP domain-containing histidine kinase [Burkholderiales bacterium]|nr:HAMP domain-containing histidine kinase [Anaerolineae bacterium]
MTTGDNPYLTQAERTVSAGLFRRVFEQIAPYIQTTLLETISEGVVVAFCEPSEPLENSPLVDGASLVSDVPIVLTINRQFSEMFAVPIEAVEGLPLAELLNQMRLPVAVRKELDLSLLSIPLNEPETQRGEFQIVYRVGVPADIAWQTIPISAPVLARIYIFRDVTSERLTERLRSLLISRAAHEMRTPLTSIQGFAEFILEDYGDQLPTLAREYTEIILNSARQLSHVFSDMLDIARAESGEFQMDMAHGHLPDLIRDVAAGFDGELRARDQQLWSKADNTLPPVLVDFHRTAQVMKQLLVNASQFAPAGSVIDIEARLIKDAAALPESAPTNIVVPCILVSITDQGEGLSEDELDAVFLPFFRTEAARIYQLPGAGLGLAVARSIMTLQGGNLWAEARQPGQFGGRFLFTMPVERS